MKLKKLFFSFLGFLFLGLLAVIVVVFFWWRWMIKPVDNKSSVKDCQELLVVNKGEKIEEIALRLEEKGLIRSALGFRLYLMIKDWSKKIQAGDFCLNPSMSLPEIVEGLSHGSRDIWVTFLEGWRSEEYVQELEEKGLNVDGDKWLKLTREGKKEGRLFPDTYLLPRTANEEKIISILEGNFFKKINESYLQTAIEKEGLLPEQVLILASLVEREARTAQDRPIVAGILVKRWRENWSLQIDATVQYAVASLNCKTFLDQKKTAKERPVSAGCDWWPKNLTSKDLEIDSPFNTYKFTGLPPAPICNPGWESIKAVSLFKETDYWFYLSDEEGKMHYAKTLEEHNMNVKRYLGK